MHSVDGKATACSWCTLYLPPPLPLRLCSSTPALRLFCICVHPAQESFVSTGIGDGGNEVGMGLAAPFLTKSAGSSIPSVERIACVSATSFLIPCSVSNWGGYALAAALGVAANDVRLRATASQHSTSRSGQDEEQQAAASPVTPECAPFVSRFIGSRDLETAICSSMVDAGARDGVTVRSCSFFV